MILRTPTGGTVGFPDDDCPAASQLLDTGAIVHRRVPRYSAEEVRQMQEQQRAYADRMAQGREAFPRSAEIAARRLVMACREARRDAGRIDTLIVYQALQRLEDALDGAAGL